MGEDRPTFARISNTLIHRVVWCARTVSPSPDSTARPTASLSSPA